MIARLGTMSVEDALAIKALEKAAIERSDGHFTIMRFTTNWRVCLNTPEEREDIARMSVATTLSRAIEKELQK